ncbi:hypothetical protein Syun_025548 [Stephania yunnanensis]|uniref:Uncharacterized protein n=1 Tax=Stephania yunnanensis TaxID=152371 RepID=A0AAP0HRC9_9MAGN
MRRETKQRREIRDDTRRILEEMWEAQNDPNLEEPARDYDKLHMEESNQEYPLYNPTVSYQSQRINPTEKDDYAKLQQRRQELTKAMPNQPVDEEAVYYNVAGECPKGRVYGLGSLGRKKRIYADSGASTSQLPEMVPRSEFDSVVEQLRQVVAFMQRQFGMTIDGAGLSQPQPQPPPPPPSPHEQQQPPQVDPTDPPQQQDNVDRDTQEWLMRDEQLGDT